MEKFITLDLSNTQDIDKAIQLIKEGYYILNMGLNLITLTK